MNIGSLNYRAFLIIFISFLFSALFTPIAQKTAIHIGAVDKPNKRRVNKVAMPTQGGLSIFASFVLGFMLFGGLNIQMLSILIGSLILIITGIIDGIAPVKAKYQFIAHILAACVVVFYGKIYLTEVSLFNIFFIIPSPINYIVSILFIVATISAINLIDGLDGLCSGVSSIYFATIAIIAFSLHKLGGLEVILSLIMFGSTLGFLAFNFPPAKIYLGNTGSMFLGFIIAVISLLGFKVATLTSLVIPITILAIPIFDTSLAILRRLINGRKISEPDKDHFHHQLLKMKFSTRTSVLIIYAINIAFAVVSVLYALGIVQYAMFIYIMMMLVLLFIVLKTDILFSHKK